VALAGVAALSAPGIPPSEEGTGAFGHRLEPLVDDFFEASTDGSESSTAESLEGGADGSKAASSELLEEGAQCPKSTSSESVTGSVTGSVTSTPSSEPGMFGRQKWTAEAWAILLRSKY
jgi:hypothetical protein